MKAVLTNFDIGIGVKNAQCLVPTKTLGSIYVLMISWDVLSQYGI